MTAIIKNQQTITLQGKKLYIFLLTLVIIMQNPQRLSAHDTQQSNNLLYLPITSNWQAVSTHTQPNATFAIDTVRLWHVNENGGMMGTPLVCGIQHKVQVHVFDTEGDVGAHSRLNDVIIQVTHWNGQMQQKSLKPTGLAAYGEGVVEFELQQWAEVKVLTDSNGQIVESDVALISTVPLAIPQTMLHQSGYCQDAADCERFVSAGTCNGAFSWNVVFKRHVQK